MKKKTTPANVHYTYVYDRKENSISRQIIQKRSKKKKSTHTHRAQFIINTIFIICF